MASPPPTVNQKTADLTTETDEGFKAAAQSFCSGIATIATFFAGFTLNIVVSADTTGHQHVRLWAAISSILFVNAALFGSSLGVLVSFYEGRLVQLLRILRERKAPSGVPGEANFGAVKAWILIPPTIVWLMIVAGILFFLLVVYSYEPAVGIAGFVVAGLGAIMSAGWLFTVLGLVLFKRDALDAPL